MARMRTLKPSFFMNETLAEVPPLGRLLFAGLWCIADREGRLEDRPKRIKAEVLPYDDANIDELLNTLHKAGFILRYACDGQRYIQVVNFVKHQSPHMKEAPSTVPAPGKHDTSTVQAPEKHGASTPLTGMDLVTGTETETRAPARDSLSLGSSSPLSDPDPEAERSADVAIFAAWCSATGRDVKMFSERRSWMGKIHELRVGEGLSPPGVAPLIAQYRAKMGADKNPSPGQVVGVYSQLIGLQSNGHHPNGPGTAGKVAGAVETEKAPGTRRRSYADLVQPRAGGGTPA